ncbi:hypothetical protein FACS1894211_14570 [Clostridia bacterium]|nr:hypothetical protein FACS1894211_14570 [Clostridia bacterium]
MTAVGTVRRPRDFGDYVVAAADKDARALLDPLALDIASVVERRFLHRRPRQLHGLQKGERRQLSRPSDLPNDLAHNRRGFLGLKFIGDRPTRKFIGKAQSVPQFQIVDLDHKAVDHVIERAFVKFFDIVPRAFGVFKQFVNARDVARPLDKVQHPRLCAKSRVRARRVIDVVEHDVDISAPRHIQIERADRARRAVAGIFEWLGGGLVILVKRGQAHDALALYFQRARIRDTLFQAPRLRRLRGHVLARHAVPARRRADVFPAPIGRDDRQPVQLMLHGHGRFEV